MAYFRIKHQCFNCCSLFTIHTQYPERVGIDTVYCPECGVTDGAFLSYQELVHGDVEDELRGNTLPTAIGKNIIEEYGKSSSVSTLRLNPQFLEKINRGRKSKNSGLMVIMCDSEPNSGS